MELDERGQEEKKIQEFFFFCPLPRVEHSALMHLFACLGVLRSMPQYVLTRGSGQKKKNSWMFFFSCPRNAMW